MSSFTKVLLQSSEFQNLSQCIERDLLPVGVTGLSGLNKTHLIFALTNDKQKKALVLTPNDQEAMRMCEDFNVFSGAENGVYYPLRDFSILGAEGQSYEYEQMRLQTLCKMARGTYTAVFASVGAAMQFTVPKKTLMKRSITLTVGTEVPPKSILEVLTHAGYTRVELVDGKGQFSLRGGILDFFSPENEKPIRAEFWGDEIDSLAFFSVNSQRRTDPIQSATITPAREVLFDTDDEFISELEALLDVVPKKNTSARENIFQDIDRLKAGVSVQSMDRYLPLAYSENSTIFDYLERGDMLFVSDTANVRERATGSIKLMDEDIKGFFEAGVLVRGLERFQLTWDEILHEYKTNGAVYLDTFARGSHDTPVKELIAFNARQNSQWSGSFEHLIDDIKPALRQGYACVVMAGTLKSAKRLASDMAREKITAFYFDDVPASFTKKAVTVLAGGFSAGLEYPKEGFLLISYGAAQQSKRKQSVKYKRKSAREAFNSLGELEKGDYIVHSMYGIGVFEGIEKIEASEITKDYIKIRYAREDVLYVPVSQLDSVSKYIGANQENARVKLNRLGTAEWRNTRKRVSAAVKEMADELIKLYAERASIQGHAFMADTDMQSDFETRFEHEETQDQLKAAVEIKGDMEKSFPMDRLLCGDVGFGKTEVALRAAFKCIVEGKQTAFLVPTTILAFQHYQNVLQRFEGFPVNIEMISRFRTPTQQREIIKNLKRGQVDIIIGTHRLLSKDVEFRDLGLIIVDEEQRFGVLQKEKLKEKFKKVDALTLSATPIPRTLNMAMSGIRDMSILEDAPQDRRPIQTYVIEHDWEMVLEAISKELRRSGQVYYLHNRVETIARTASFLQEKLPDANIGIVHGQMNEAELSEVWRGLVVGEIDVLVCTTIIETGVDVPNVNTLIIENADHMGLAQLHQIRGRVGRSARRAYAFLTFQRGKSITEIATHRLNAIREYTEFGSGFKIAMRDLEIRGAGNILGSQQHGHMEAVGYDLYMKMLERAVKVAKGEEAEEPAMQEEILMDLQVEAHIPETYIASVPQRLYMYRRIADIENPEDALDVVDELIDRFGTVPKSVHGLIDVSLLRARAKALHLYEVAQRGERLLLYSKGINMKHVSALSQKMPRKVAVNASDKPYISLQILSKDVLKTLTNAFEIMEKTTENE